MPTVEFVMDDIVYEAETGKKLLDICKESGSSIPFGCTNGICGTCITKVVRGKKSLNKMSEREQQTLEMFDVDDGEHRLMCQCVLQGDVELDNP